MCLIDFATLDRDTQRSICELESLLQAKYRRNQEIDVRVRERADRNLQLMRDKTYTPRETNVEQAA